MRSGRLDAHTVPTYARVAMVRGGRSAVTAAVLCDLFTQGAVETSRRGTVHLPETTMPTVSPQGFARVVWNAIHGMVAPGALASRPSIDKALTELRRLCVREGLIRSWLPAGTVFARTRAGRHLIKALKLQLPFPDARPKHEALNDALSMLVALYGLPALFVCAPDFGTASGLLTGSSSDELDEADVRVRDNPTDWSAI